MSLKRALYFYQRFFWYVAQAKNEGLKPLGFWNETLLILTFLSVRGYEPTVPMILGGYTFLLILAVIIGKIIVVLGIVRYNNRINNHQNAELMEILNRLKEIEGYIKKD